MEKNQKFGYILKIQIVIYLVLRLHAATRGPATWRKTWKFQLHFVAHIVIFLSRRPWALAMFFWLQTYFFSGFSIVMKRSKREEKTFQLVFINSLPTSWNLSVPLLVLKYILPTISLFFSRQPKHCFCISPFLLVRIITTLALSETLG